MSTRDPEDGNSVPEWLAWLEAAAADLGVTLSEAQRAQFTRYLDLLLEWNERAGLTTVTDPLEVARRHFAESLAYGAVLRDEGLLESGASLVDLGSGAGLPGVPIAIAWPSLAVTLLESHGRRAQFLEAVIEELGLEGALVVQARAEDAGRDTALREHFDVAAARALAPLAVLVEYALPLVRSGGTLAALKGSRAGEEIEAAAAAIEALGGELLEVRAAPMPDGSLPQDVVLVRRVRALDPRYPRRAGMPTKRPLR
ncbi:MAG: 16S rRNA (guanine(527)-N(7))-methyltransferase RsmG [Dehalococcoidia bacterium]